MAARVETSRPPRVHLPAVVLMLVGALAVLLWTGRDRLSSSGLFPNSDFQTYYKAGAMVRVGIADRALYPSGAAHGSPVSRVFGVDREAIRDLNRRLPSHSRLPENTYDGFAYPPFAALVFAPLTWLPMESAGLAWRVFLVVLSAWALLGLRGVLTRSGGVSSRDATGILLACVVTWPFLYSLRMGQAGHLLFVAVALAMVAISRHRFGWAGAALATGALIKVLPLLPLVIFFRGAARRAWLAAALVLVAGTLAVVPVVSPLVAARYFSDLAPYLHTAAGRINNQSVLGLVSHMTMSPESRTGLLERPELMPEPVKTGARWAAIGLVVLAVSACAWEVRGAVALGVQRPLIASVATLAAVAPAVTPLSWPYSYVLALPAYALGLAWLLEHRRLGRGRFAIAIGLQLLWLLAPTALPEDFGRNVVERLLLSPTFFAGVASAFLAWTWGRSRAPRAA